MSEQQSEQNTPAEAPDAVEVRDPAVCGTGNEAPSAPAGGNIVKRDPRAAGRLGGLKGGKRNRHQVMLLGLGVPVAERLDLDTHGDRKALIAAVVAAVSGGKCSALTAQTLLAAVREARTEAAEAWEALARRQHDMIEELRHR